MVNKKKVLIIGNGNHIFINSLTRRLKSMLENVEFWLLPYPWSYNKIKETNKSSFDIILNPNKPNVIFGKIPFIKNKYKKYIFIKNFEEINVYFDLIHIHYIENYLNLIDNLLLEKSKKILTTVWGSDFYRRDASEFLKYKKILKESSIITTSNKLTMDSINGIVEIPIEKQRICRFGLDPLNILKNKNFLKNEVLSEFKIPSNSIVVTLGYNANPNQQHLLILESIIKILERLPNSLFFLLPLTYGGNKKYISEIKSILDYNELNYQIFSDYLSDEKVAKIRFISDIMIQLQTTDVLSGSMMEHLFTGNIVITCEWLPYKILDEYNIYYHKIQNINDVGLKLVDCVNNLIHYKKLTHQNRNKIWELASWDSNLPNWIEVYKELM